MVFNMFFGMLLNNFKKKGGDKHDYIFNLI